MTILLIFIFLIIAGGLLLLKRIKACAVMLVLALLGVIFTGSGLLPLLLLKPLQAPFVNVITPKWKDKNAIVLLGAGAVRLANTQQVQPTVLAYSRIYKAADLYFSCMRSHKQCKIIITGGDASHTGLPEAKVYKDALLNLKVDASNIETEDSSLNTYENAEFTSAILKKQQFDQVILATSGFHLKRSILYFSHFEIHVIPAPADYLSYQLSIIPLGYNFAVADFTIHEYIGIMRFYIYQFMGWNKYTPLTSKFVFMYPLRQYLFKATQYLPSKT